jgi:hypothetical protein
VLTTFIIGVIIIADDGSSKHHWSADQFLLDYTAQNSTHGHCRENLKSHTFDSNAYWLYCRDTNLSKIRPTNLFTSPVPNLIFICSVGLEMNHVDGQTLPSPYATCEKCRTETMNCGVCSCSHWGVPAVMEQVLFSLKVVYCSCLPFKETPLRGTEPTLICWWNQKGHFSCWLKSHSIVSGPSFHLQQVL